MKKMNDKQIEKMEKFVLKLFETLGIDPLEFSTSNYEFVLKLVAEMKIKTDNLMAFVVKTNEELRKKGFIGSGI